MKGPHVKKRIINGIKSVLILSLIFAAIGFVNKKHKAKSINNIVIHLDNQFDNFFVDENDILRLIGATEGGQIMNASLSSIDLRTLERKVRKEKYIKEVEIFKDLKGNIIINATQRRPVARVLNSNKTDDYITWDGTILPVSDKYTSRVLLLRGDHEESLSMGNIQDSEYGEHLFKLIKFISTDDFWKAQIAGIEVLPSGDINMQPQVTKQQIEFGKPENIEVKFRNLEIFYKKILPRKGWNYYTRVNLKYEGQIICE
jgi:cell division protein FtsQ